MRRVGCRAQGGRGLQRLREVDGDGVDTLHRPPCEGAHLPALGLQFAHQRVADDAAGAGDQCHTCHGKILLLLRLMWRVPAKPKGVLL
jgi:hypothetical protein